MTTRVPIVAVLVVVGVFAGLTGVRLVYTLSYLMILILVASWVWSRSLGKRVRVHRASPAGSYSVGDSFEETFTVHNRSVLPLVYCEIEDRSLLRGYRPNRVCSLPPKGSVTWKAQGTFDRRGRHSFGPVVARLGDPFGLFPRTVHVAPQADVIVFPALHRLDDVALNWSGGGFDTEQRGRVNDHAPDVSGVREYTGGDSLSRIHWASVARTGRLMSRVYDTQESSDQLIVLDLAAGVHCGEDPDSTLEYAVSICASLAHAGLRAGRAVSLVTNDKDSTVIGAQRGEAQRLRMLEYLALAQSNGKQPLADLIAQQGRMWRGRGGMVVITPRGDRDWMDALLDVGTRGQRHLGVVVDGSSFGGPSPPFRPGAAWRLAIDWWVVRYGDSLDTASQRVMSR